MTMLSKEGFEYMRENINILDYLPDVIKEIKEFDAIATAENPEINNLWQNHQKVFDNQFISTLDADGCTRWEKMLGLTSSTTQTLETRRLQILTKINTSLPYTIRQLENILTGICGNDYEINLDNTNYTLDIFLNLSVRNQFNYVYEMLKKIVPANLVLTVSLKYNKYMQIRPYTYSVLINYTCYQIRTEDNLHGPTTRNQDLEDNTHIDLHGRTHHEIAYEDLES